MLPIVRYTGHAFLSPWKRVSWVLSEESISGAMVAPVGSFDLPKESQCFLFFLFKQSYLGIPPPVSGPHFIKNSDLALVIHVYALCHIGYKVFESGISD